MPGELGALAIPASQDLQALLETLVQVFLSEVFFVAAFGLLPIGRSKPFVSAKSRIETSRRLQAGRVLNL